MLHRWSGSGHLEPNSENRVNSSGNPLTTAAAFTAFVVAMDFFVVASLILGSYAIFYSALGM